MIEDKMPSTTGGGTVGIPDRKPPMPGAMWCDSCSAWCLPPGICRCNYR